jgi:hypothetical protein
MNDDNVIPFGSVKGGKDEDTVPEHDYEIIDQDGGVHKAKGFMIFTPHHIAIMRALDEGALPVVVLPLTFVKFAKIDEGMQHDLPF